MTFTKAEKKTAKLRLALVGPSGSGKTYSALSIASGLGKRIAVIDTQARQSEKYADLFEFDIDELTVFHPHKYIAAMREAEKAGYDVIIIDSLSHAWSGKGGVLEIVDQTAKAHAKENKFSAWKDASPIHNELLEAILRCKAHLIATMRSKTEYVLEVNERGKQVPKKVGMAPVQRDGVEYEFDFVLEMDDATALVTTSRWKELTRTTVKEPGKAFGEKLMGWLQEGKEPAAAPPLTQKPKTDLEAAGKPASQREPGADDAEGAEDMAVPENPEGPASYEELKTMAFPEGQDAPNAVWLRDKCKLIQGGSRTWFEVMSDPALRKQLERVVGDARKAKGDPSLKWSIAELRGLKAMKLPVPGGTPAGEAKAG